MSNPILKLKVINSFINEELVILFIENKKMRWFVKKPIPSARVSEYFKRYADYDWVFCKLIDLDLSIFSKKIQKQLFLLEIFNGS